MSENAMPDGKGEGQGEGQAPMPLFKYKGIALPPICTQEHMEALADVQFRPDDILLCSFPKTGTHWTFEMLKMLVEGKAEPLKNEVIEKSALEFPSCDLTQLDQWPSPRIFTTHLPARLLPSSVLDSKCRVVVVERNVKDVLVSFFAMISKSANNISQISWQDFFSSFCAGIGPGAHYYDHVKDFRKCAKDNPENPIAFFRYEKMKQDHVGELGRLSQFLGLDSSSQLLADIAALTEFKSMKKYKEAAEVSPLHQKIFKSGKDEMYRKGEVGDWKNWFTVAQSDTLDALHLKQMGEPFKEM